RVGVPKTGAALQAGIDGMADLIDGLLAAGVKVEPATSSAEQATSDEKKTVCISGKLPSGKKKNDYAAGLESAGYELVSLVNQSLDYLVLADPSSTSSKAQKARKLDIRIISEEDLMSLIQGQKDLSES
ncbi:MAG: hypothetical protein MK135_12700, partial [Polyangiaceae bacterium]|nr:hypothetical protein [Polyangiaceae bacterium]